MQSVAGEKQGRVQTANWLSWIKLLKQLTWVMLGAVSNGFDSRITSHAQ